MRSRINTKALKYLAVLVFIAAVSFWLACVGGTGEAETALKAGARAFTLILWSILLEALPFVLLGTLVSSLIQLYVSEETIIRLLPKRRLMQLVFAALLGIVFPVCECAIIPITRGLVKKGLPIGPAMAFMTAVPIVNPIVVFSTYSAFSSVPEMAVLRTLLGFVAAVTIGLVVSRADGRSVLKKTPATGHASGCGHSHGCGCTHHAQKKGFAVMAMRILAHTGDELKSVGAYLIFGAGIAASMQVFVPRAALMHTGQGKVSSILVMMMLAFVLSLCSEADAFVASTFMTSFSGASVLAFLITGPMIDIKNTMMLFGSFGRRFVIKLILVILITCFVLSLGVSFLWGGA